MNLKTILKNLTADATFNRTRRGAALRLSNFQGTDFIGEIMFDSCGGYGILRGHVKPMVKAWMEEHAQGKYRIDECYDTIMVHFSRDTDAVMYKLSGPYA
jgi:hypothetical protein